MAQGFYDLIGSMFSAPDQWVSDGSYRTTSPSLPANVPTPMSVRGLNAVGDFIPGYGDVKAIGEAGQALSQGELLAAGLLGTGAAIGLVPGAGDVVARPVIAAGRRVADAVPSEAIYAGRSLAEGDFGGVLDAFTPGRPAQSLSAMSVYHASPYEISGPLRAGSNDVGVHVAANPDLARNASIKSLLENPSEAENVKVFEFSLDVSPDQVAEISGASNRFNFYDILDDLLGSNRISENTYNAIYDGLEQIEDTAPIYSDMMEQQNALFSRELMEREDIKALKYLNEFDAGPNWMDLEAGRFESSVKPDTSYILLDPSQVSQQGTLSDPAAQRGDEILGLLSSGRAADVTDEMLDMGDPVLNTRLNEYLFNNYDLPMDEASRMSRAQEMGFGGGRYHGSNMDFPNFSGSAFTSDNPTVASTYNRGMQDAVIYPLMTREGVGGTVNVGGGLSNWNQLRPDMIDDPYVARELDMGMPISTRDIERQAKFEGFSGANFNDINDLGPGFNSQQFKNIGYTPEDAEAMRLQYLNELSAPSNVDVRFYPNLSRSRFARFDPRLSHLRNLSAGIGAIGLLGAMDRDQLQQDTRNYLAGGA